MEWSQIENIIGEEIPSCIKIILHTSGFDSLTSIEKLCEKKIVEIEGFIDSCKQNVVSKLSCCHSEQYKEQKQFKILPGHRAIMETLPAYAKKIREDGIKSNKTDINSFSVVLSELIKTAEANALKDKHHASYSDINRYFSTYIYLLSGRSCYETLQQNLPIPSTKTICKLL